MTGGLIPMTKCDKKLFLDSKRRGLGAVKARAIGGAILMPASETQSSYMPPTDADVARLDAEQKAIEREQQAQLVEAQYHKCGVPQKFYDARLDALFTSGLVNAIDKDKKPLTRERTDAFIQNVKRGKPQSMWMCGDAGTGKTAIACAIVHELVRRGVKCKYFKSHEIMARLEDARMRASHETRASIMKDVTECKLVVIDEAVH